LQVELKGGRIDWRAIVESRSGRGEERIVTCALQRNRHRTRTGGKLLGIEDSFSA
jgi:hypothetical protein